MVNHSDQIEILSVSLLDQYAKTVESFLELSALLNLSIGWHYPLDLSWAAESLSVTHGQTVLDAGAGYGSMQWWLAGHGVNVISVDRDNRARLNIDLRAWCSVRGLRKGDLNRLGPLETLHKLRRRQQLKNFGLGYVEARMRGCVVFYNQDLTSLEDVPDNSVDAVVSISALEHNSIEGLHNCVTELLRIIKPGGKLVATLAAARENDWYHEQSKGWCFCEKTLKEVFSLEPDCPSNFNRFDDCFECLRNNEFLRENLVESYFQSGDNGMPWGVWDPKYQPVGVIKVKR